MSKTIPDQTKCDDDIMWIMITDNWTVDEVEAYRAHLYNIYSDKRTRERQIDPTLNEYLRIYHNKKIQ